MKLFKVFFLALALNAFAVSSALAQSSEEEPKLRLGIIGLVHDHVHWIFNRDNQDLEVVGIVETNQAAIDKFKARYNLDDSLFFSSYEELMRKAQPQAVSAFNETAEHLEVATFFLPKNIPVMVEKPLATSYKDAQQMVQLSEKHQVPLLVNYETSWYESTYETKALIEDGTFGKPKKLVFNTGHMGPVEIGCSPEFLAWLTDPVLNGGGAVTDFGCYGANISTWLLDGRTPERVTAVLKQSKPSIYPKVDDDTTIILDYKDLQVVIQASWNWTHHRKDMEVYLNKASIYALDANRMRILDYDSGKEQSHQPASIEAYQKDPFRLLVEVVQQGREIDPQSLYGTANNLTVVKLLELAKRSAELERTVAWSEL